MVGIVGLMPSGVHNRPEWCEHARRFAIIHFVNTTDNTRGVGIKGDVETVRRVPGKLGGKRGTDQGLIEVALVGHPHRYRVRVDMSGPAPRLVELHISSPDDVADIDPAAMRIPVRRLAHAAAHFISHADGAFVTPEELDDPVRSVRPEVVERRRTHLDDEHYRDVARLLMAARREGARSPRKVVAQQRGWEVPTLDRWINEAKLRGHLPRDWATTYTLPTEENER